MIPISERTICKNGVSLSIQANAFTFCSPRNNIGPWTHFEVGFVRDANGKIIHVEEFCINGFDEDVYHYVPKEVINTFIEKNGGPVIMIDEKKKKLRNLYEAIRDQLLYSPR